MTSSNSSRHDGAKEEQQDGGDERASSASAGLLCLPRVDDDDGPMDTAEISAFLGRQELTKSAQMIDDPQPSSLVQSNSAAAECDDEEQSEVQTADEVPVDGGPSASSTSAGLCRAEDDEGPTEISAFLGRQERDGKEEAQRIDSPTSSSAAPPSRRESSVSSVRPSPAETNLTASARDLITSPTNGDRPHGQALAQQPLSMESSGIVIIEAQARPVPVLPVCSASVIEVIPW